jgi:hypothetical protein
MNQKIGIKELEWMRNQEKALAPIVENVVMLSMKEIAFVQSVVLNQEGSESTLIFSSSSSSSSSSKSSFYFSPGFF